MRRTLLWTIVIVLSAAPACSKAASGSASCPNPSSSTTITVADFDFGPACVVAHDGTTLTLHNTGNAPHTYTVGGTSIDVKLDPGQMRTVSVAGVAPGTYAVVCKYHPQMTGALKVS